MRSLSSSTFNVIARDLGRSLVKENMCHPFWCVEELLKVNVSRVGQQDSFVNAFSKGVVLEDGLAVDREEFFKPHVGIFGQQMSAFFWLICNLENPDITLALNRLWRLWSTCEYKLFTADNPNLWIQLHDTQIQHRRSTHTRWQSKTDKSPHFVIFHCAVLL